MSEIIQRLGSQDEPWTQAQIDSFMEEMERETFDDDMRRGVEGSIVGITREGADGNQTRYVKEDGEWTEE